MRNCKTRCYAIVTVIKVSIVRSMIVVIYANNRQHGNYKNTLFYFSNHVSIIINNYTKIMLK